MALEIRKELKRVELVRISLLLASGLITLMATPFTKAFTAQAPSTHSELAVHRKTLSENTTKTMTTQAKKDTPTIALTAQRLAVTAIPNENCILATPAHVGMAQSNLSQLQKISQYEQVCQSAITDKVSFFTTLPTTTDDAIIAADDVARNLKEYARFNIQPLVFLEPTNKTGLVDISELRNGAYDQSIDVYFSQLKALGVTDAMMGTWVPIPEGNVPVWESVNPDDFSGSVTKIATIQKRIFPTSKTSVLLDTMSYPAASSWQGGRAVSLLPYVQTIPKGLLDSIGLQGFPWEPPATQKQSNNGSAKDYVRVDLLIEAARATNVRNVWVNSGTFSTAYSGQASNQVNVSAAQRQRLLDGVLTQLIIAQNAGLNVSMHLFAEDKSRVKEGINWSYWPSNQQASSNATIVFKSFVHRLQANHIPLWIFDAGD